MCCGAWWVTSVPRKTSRSGTCWPHSLAQLAGKVQASRRLTQEKQTLTIAKPKVNRSWRTASKDDLPPEHTHTTHTCSFLPSSSYKYDHRNRPLSEPIRYSGQIFPSVKEYQPWGYSVTEKQRGRTHECLVFERTSQLRGSCHLNSFFCHPWRASPITMIGKRCPIRSLLVWHWRAMTKWCTCKSWPPSANLPWGLPIHYHSGTIL